MTFVKGQSGNPGGRRTEKQWRDAVRKAVHAYIGDIAAPHPAKSKVIDVLAHKLVVRALEGDVPAIKEVGDRLDGKAAQSLDVTHNSGETLERFIALIDKLGSAEATAAVAAGLDREQEQPAPVRH